MYLLSNGEIHEIKISVEPAPPPDTTRSSTIEEVHDREVVKVEGVLANQSRCSNSQDHWESDVAEFLPSIGTVNISCFVKVVRNRLQDTQSQNVDVWESKPTLHHNQGNFVQVGSVFQGIRAPSRKGRNLAKIGILEC